MTGYLQRLVSSARNSGGAIHPVVGSLFSAPRYHTMPDILGLEEEVTVLGSPAPRGPLDFGSPVAVPESTGALITPPISPSRAGQAAPVDETVTAAHTQTLAQDDSGSAFTPPGERESRLHQLPDQEHGNQRFPMSRQPMPAERTPSEALLETSLIAPNRTADSTWPPDPMATFRPEPHTGRQTRATSSPRAPVAHASPEPDEIHIHIGRIEVTAVPPPAERPAPTRARLAAPSLDEYLRRRDGRNS